MNNLNTKINRTALHSKIALTIAVLCFTIGVVTATPQQDYTLYGTATLNEEVLTAQDGDVISLEVGGVELVGYTMGDIATDNYVLKVPMDSDPSVTTAAQEGDTAYIYINGIAINEGAQVIGAPATTVQLDISATSANDPPSTTVLHPNGGESTPLGTQVQVSAHATDDTAVTSVTFSYSSNGGSDWNSIGAGTRVSGTAKDGIWNRTWNTNSLGAGSNYLIRAVASDGTSTDNDQSDSTFSLTCTPPSAPTLNDPGTTDTDGSYTVSWGSISGATSYTLEEGTSGSFGSPTVVYSGPGTSKHIIGRGDGTYYYRANACNACGCSEWSDVGDIVVAVGGPAQIGDLNGDGDITIADAAIALQLAASGGWHPAADVSGDGSITSLDALMILTMVQKMRVYVNAPEVVSDTFNVTIDLYDVVDLDSGQFDLRFDPAVLNVVDVDDGSISGTTIRAYNWAIVGGNNVRVIFNLASVYGVSGSGYLAKIDFAVTGSQGEACILDISNGLLVDTSAEEIPSTWIGDEVTIGAPTP